MHRATPALLPLCGCLGAATPPPTTPPAPSTIEATLDLGDDTTHATAVDADRLPALLAAAGIQERVEDASACGDSDRIYEATALHATLSRSEGSPLDAFGLQTRRCGQPPDFLEGQLLVMEGATLLGRLSDACVQDLIALPPAGGLPRLLGLCGGTGQGYTETYARVYGLRDGALVQLQDLGLVGLDDCGVSEDGHALSATLRVAADGTLSATTSRASCSDTGKRTVLHAGFPSTDDLGGG